MTQELIQLTTAAAAHIQQKIDSEAGARYFRLGIKRTGCSGWMYVPEVVTEPAADDHLAAQVEGVSVYITDNSRDMICGTTIDYIEKSLGFKQLEFNNPQATSLCGCGESFQIKEQDDD